MKLLNVIDLELTCWEANHYMQGSNSSEIIEVGVVPVDIERLEIVGKHSFLVRPTRSEVSEYCTKLTGITPKMVANRRPIEEVIKTLIKKFGFKSRPFGAWGRDWEALPEEVGLSKTTLDIQYLYQISFAYGKRNNLVSVLKELGMEFEGNLHRGVDDAWNTARILIEILKRIRK